jgi:hypothetical protein
VSTIEDTPGTSSACTGVALTGGVKATILATHAVVRLDISPEEERSIAMIALHRELDIPASCDTAREGITSLQWRTDG